MPVQNYNINTRDAVAGVLYGMQQTRADIQTYFAEGEIMYGRAVQDGANPKGIVAGGEAHVLGIALRSIGRENKLRPSNDGFVTFVAGDAVPVCSDGRVNVNIEASGAVVRGEAAYVLPNGNFTPTATGATKCTNVVWGETKTLGVDDITHVVITNADLNATI